MHADDRDSKHTHDQKFIISFNYFFFTLENFENIFFN